MRKLTALLTALAAAFTYACAGTSFAKAEAYDQTFEKQISAFPESYKPALRALHEQHPKWVFTPVDTGLEWSDVVKEETLLGRSLVNGTSPEAWKSMEKGAYNFTTGTWYGLDGSWVAASDAVVKYNLDPRNFINDTYVFMFENLSYNPEIHTITGVQNILADTFMRGNYTCPDTGEVKNYAETFMEAAERAGVSPYHMAGRCRNEQGVNGAIQSLGTAPGYEGYFNFFDVQAYATSTLSAGQMGARYAMTYNPTYLLPWTNQYKSIIGGAIYLGSGYINKGQDTIYFQKFDVTDGGNGYYYHQYMTCINGAAIEGKNLRKAYNSKVLESALEFKIPFYKNMPDSPVPEPPSTGSNNNLLSSLTVSGCTLSPSFDKYTQSYTATVDGSVSSVKVTAKALGSGAKISGTGNVSLSDGKNTLNIKVTSTSGDVRTYKVVITKKASTSLKKGDIDGSGTVDVTDALLILSHNAGEKTLPSAQLSRADIDANGRVDVTDALLILQYVSGKTKSL
ncbi:MAG: cadherin-like beta sandwich domain-containing protein [Ruminococcus sp.]|nr:cadherin-like beta sandwich domain-containing protein [Ruminococcus sp.]